MQSDHGFVRAIGLRQLTASIINVTIGAGIFVLPPPRGDPRSAAPIARRLRRADGAHRLLLRIGGQPRVVDRRPLCVVEVAFGPFVGFLGGVLYALMASFAVASVASAFAGSVDALLFPESIGAVLQAVARASS